MSTDDPLIEKEVEPLPSKVVLSHLENVELK